MSDSVRVTLESTDESRAVRVYDDEGDVSTGDATFRFSVDGGTEGESDDAAGAAGASGDDPRRIAPLAAVPTNGTLRCEARRDRRGTELILRQEGGEVAAWRNSCPHEPTSASIPGRGRSSATISWCVTNTAHASSATTASVRRAPAGATRSTRSRSPFATGPST